MILTTTPTRTQTPTIISILSQTETLFLPPLRVPHLYPMHRPQIWFPSRKPQPPRTLSPNFSDPGKPPLQDLWTLLPISVPFFLFLSRRRGGPGRRWRWGWWMGWLSRHHPHLFCTWSTGSCCLLPSSLSFQAPKAHVFPTNPSNAVISDWPPVALAMALFIQNFSVLSQGF